MNCVPYKCYDYDHWFYGIAYGKADAEANHLTGNNGAEFGVGLLDSYFFKLSLGSDSLELRFWTVGSKTILSYNNNITKLSGLDKTRRISLSLNLTPKLCFEPFRMFIINCYYTKT